MSIPQLRNTNLGRSKAGLTGSTGVGFTVFNFDGSINQARTTSGVYEVTASSGIYAAYVTFPNDFRGSIFWDSGEPIAIQAMAVEQYNAEENNPNVDVILGIVQGITGSITHISGTIDVVTDNIQFLKDMEGGRWKVTTGNQMIFYKPDNVTEIARFDLFDISGASTNDAVTERKRV